MQLELGFVEEVRLCGRGGKRKGSGRKKSKRTVSHAPRERIRKREVVLVTWKRRIGLDGFRQAREATVIVEAIKASKTDDFRVVHFSIIDDHIHFVIEVDSNEALTRGTKSLGCRLSRGLNKLWNRTGKVFVGRFHARLVRSLKQVRHVLAYVLNNHRKHGCWSEPGKPDLFSSGNYFDGWSDFAQVWDPHDPESYVSPPGWMIKHGWKQRYPLIPVSTVPGR